jgi:hypothetical protein
VNDRREQPSNVFDSTRVMRESRSKEIDLSDRQPRKQCGQRISTFRGIVIDVSGQP